MIAREISRESTDHLRTLGRDGIDLYLAAEGTVRVVLVQASALVTQMAANHATRDHSSVALGEAYVATLLMGSTLKNDERLGLLYDDNGRGFTCDVDGTGSVRGYLRHDDERGIPRDPNGVWSPGTLGVIRYQGRNHTPFSGETEVSEGSLADAVEAFVAISDQTPSRFQLVVEAIGPSVVAGGILVQGLPGADEEAIESLHRLLHIDDGIPGPFGAGETPSRYVATRLDGHEIKFVGSRRAEFYCGCNRERFGRFLAQLPRSERDDILENGPLPLVTTCHNCNSSYSFERDELALAFTAADSA